LVTFHPSRYTTVASNALFSEQRAREGENCGCKIRLYKHTKHLCLTS
jgi:hypothetical protein